MKNENYGSFLPLCLLINQKKQKFINAAPSVLDFIDTNDSKILYRQGIIMKAVLIAIVMITAGCTSNSGVVPVGEGLYLISRSEKGFDRTGSGVKANALKEANSYCEQNKKQIQVVEASSKDMVPFKSDAQAEIHFKCQ